jgi:hypothetical protein
VALIDAGDDLGPTDVLSRSETRSIAGRRLRLGVARHAATAGDVWLFDPATSLFTA